MAVDDAYSKALLHFNGLDGATTFTDESGKIWTANNDAQIDTGQSVFGGASGLFDGTGDYISTPDTSDFDFGTGDFAIDFRIRLAANPGNGYWTIFQIGAYGSGIAMCINVGNSNNIHANIMGTTYDFSGTIALNTWYHIALTRSGTDLKLFLDGTQAGSTGTSSENILIASESWIGRSADGYVNGWFDEFRISKGVPRWTSDFTIPADEYGPAPVPGVTLNFTSAPLFLTLSGDAEIHLIDFSGAPLTFYPVIKFGDVTLEFGEYPFEMTLAASLTDMMFLDMGTAPLIFTASFNTDFESRGANRVSGNWPSPVVTGRIECRSARAAAAWPSFSLAAHVLSGEVIRVEGSWPAFDVAAAGHTNEIADVSGNYPAYKVRGRIIAGAVADVSGSFPGYNVAATGFQSPRIAVAGNWPVCRINAFVQGRAEILKRQYRATVLNLKNMAVTKYEDFSFNSLCFFNGVYLGANENGIFILGGETDNGTEIDWSFKTPEIDLLNAVPADIWLSMRNSQAASLKVIQNEAETGHTYPVNADPDPRIHMERVKLGRGLDARVFQLELSGTGPVDLNQMAVVTNPLKKSKR